jgi:hypothetical protein
MNVKTHIVTLPIEDYNELIKNQQKEGMVHIQKGTPLFEKLQTLVDESTVHQRQGIPANKFLDYYEFYMRRK